MSAQQQAPASPSLAHGPWVARCRDQARGTWVVTPEAHTAWVIATCGNEADARAIAELPNLFRRACDVNEGLDPAGLGGAMPIRLGKLQASLAKLAGVA